MVNDAISFTNLSVSKLTTQRSINTVKEIVSQYEKINSLLMVASVGALASPVKADLTSRITSSVQLQVNAAATQMQRVGNSYSIAGTNAVSYTHLTLPTIYSV